MGNAESENNVNNQQEPVEHSLPESESETASSGEETASEETTKQDDPESVAQTDGSGEDGDNDNGFQHHSRSKRWAVRVGLVVIQLLIFLGVVMGLVNMMKKSVEEKTKALEAARAKAGESGEAERIPVQVKAVGRGPMTDAIMLPGMIRPWEEVSVKAEVTGKVVKLLVDEGDEVTAGDVVAVVDARDYEAALREARASLKLAEQNLNRDKALYEDNVIPAAKLDSTRASKERAVVAVELAELRLERCSITAPIDGVVEARHVALGSLLTPGTPLIELVDVSRVKVDVGIPELDIDDVRDVTNVEITVPALGDDATFMGKTMYVSMKPEEGGQTYRLRLAVENPGKRLQPGMFVDARVVREHKLDAIMIPLYSVIARGNETFCFVADNGVARQTTVQVGRIQNNMAEVLSGLAPGQRLIVRGQRQVEAGQAVSVRRPGDLGLANDDGGAPSEHGSTAQ